MKRPWVVTWRSHEFEWNGRGGRRFGYEERARAEARQRIDDGAYDVRVWLATEKDWEPR